MRSKSKTTLPIPVRRALKKMGNDIKDARRRRRITMEMMANRSFITRATLSKVERGDPGVSMGIYATVLFILGTINRISDLMDIKFDAVGLGLEEERLPKRVRYKSWSSNTKNPSKNLKRSTKRNNTD